MSKNINIKNNSKNFFRKKFCNSTIHSYKDILKKWIPFSILVLVLLIIKWYINAHTLVALEGNPKNVKITNFEGDVALDTRVIDIDKGYIRNRDTINFVMNGETYTALPGELTLFFDTFDGFDELGITRANYILSQNNDMYFSTTISSDYKMHADSICFEREDSSFSFLHEKISRESGNASESKIKRINFVNPITEGLLQIQNGEELIVAGGVSAYFHGEKIAKESFEIELINNMSSIAFELCDISNMDIMLNETVGLALVGEIDELDGEFEAKNGRIIKTAPSKQEQFELDAQNVEITGERMKIEYNFRSEVSEMIVKGKVKKAKLEDIDMREGWVQFFLSNCSALFLGLLGTMCSNTISNALKKQE